MILNDLYVWYFSKPINMVDKKLRTASLLKDNASAPIICPVSPVVAPLKAFTKIISDIKCMISPNQPIVVTPPI